MLRVKYNRAYPYNIVMMKHAPFIATEKSVKAHETRPDGRALSENTGYQANLRYGSQQSVTRNWHMPMHQTDTLFHKAKAFMSFIFGGEADNHAVNTVPKGNPGPRHQGRRRRPGRQRHLEAGDDRLHAGQRERVDEALSGGRSDEGESMSNAFQRSNVPSVQPASDPPPRRGGGRSEAVEPTWNDWNPSDEGARDAL